MVKNDTVGESTPLLGGCSKTSLTPLKSAAPSEIPFYSRTVLDAAPPTLPPTSAKYPRAVYFILLSKFFESFAANGVRSVLALYLRDSLHYSEDFSTAVLHIFNFFGQFCPIFGAVLADSYIGNVCTIFYFMFLYASGWIGMIVVSLIGPSDAQFLPLLISSLVLIATGNGSIRACISALGGSQFQLPEQTEALQRYFSHYYFIYYGGILLSKVVPPSVRSNTHCLGRPDCYAAVFGMLALVFFMCWLMFLCGLPYYRTETAFSKENILGKVTGCVWHAIQRAFAGRSGRRRRSSATHQRPSTRWIDCAIGAYPEEFVDDVWNYLKVVVLFLPLPVYFALLAQQDSTWTFQATQLNTRLWGIEIEADQAKAVGPVIMLIMIPVWEHLCLPLLRRVGGIEISPLRSITLGAMSAVLAFLCAAILQLYIETEMLQRAGQEVAANATQILAVTLTESSAAASITATSAATAPTAISILWQVPQFFLLMMGEVLLSIPGLQFAFTEAPATMKSVLAATWFLNNAMGNLLVVVLTELHWFRRPSTVFVVYTLLMLVSVLVFVAIASRYEYRSERQRRKLAEASKSRRDMC